MYVEHDLFRATDEIAATLNRARAIRVCAQLGVIAKRLAETRLVIAVDMRNHGLSDWFQTHTYEDLAQDLADVVAHAGAPWMFWDTRWVEKPRWFWRCNTPIW